MNEELKQLILSILGKVPCVYVGILRPCYQYNISPHCWCENCRTRYQITEQIKSHPTKLTYDDAMHYLAKQLYIAREQLEQTKPMNINQLAAEIVKMIPDLAKDSVVNQEQALIGVIKREQQRTNTVESINETLKARECLCNTPPVPDYA